LINLGDPCKGAIRRNFSRTIGTSEVCPHECVSSTR